MTAQEAFVWLQVLLGSVVYAGVAVFFFYWRVNGQRALRLAFSMALFRRGGGPQACPHFSWPARLWAPFKGLIWISWGTSCLFFLRYPLKIHISLKVSGMYFREDSMQSFFVPCAPAKVTFTRKKLYLFIQHTDPFKDPPKHVADPSRSLCAVLFLKKEAVNDMSFADNFKLFFSFVNVTAGASLSVHYRDALHHRQD